MMRSLGVTAITCCLRLNNQVNPHYDKETVSHLCPRFTLAAGETKDIGVDPFHIDFPADKQEDFDTFWADAYPTGWDAKYLSYFKSYIK